MSMLLLEISKKNSANNACLNHSVNAIGLEVGSKQWQDDVNFNGFVVMLRVGEVLLV